MGIACVVVSGAGVVVAGKLLFEVVAGAVVAGGCVVVFDA